MFDIKDHGPLIPPEPWSWLLHAGDTRQKHKIETMMVLWIEDILNDLIYKGVRPEDIKIDQKRVGKFYLPIVSVYGKRRYMFHPYMERTHPSDISCYYKVRFKNESN